MEEAITRPISGKEKIDTVRKTEKSKSSNKTVDTPKSNKPTQLNHQINQGLLKELSQKTQQINQGLFQDQVILIKVPEQKNTQK